MDFFFQSIGYKIAFADMKYESASTFWTQTESQHWLFHVT